MLKTGHPGGLRVLIENGDPVVASAQAAALRQAGYRVAVCGGPASLIDGCCPAVEHDSCSLAAGADLILYDLDLDEPGERAVLASVRRLWPDIPVVLEIPSETAIRYADELSGCHVVAPFDMDRLVTAVAEVSRGA